MAKKLNREESPKGSPLMSPKRSLVRRGVPEATYKGGAINRKRDIAMEDVRAHRASIHLPPLQRVKRAPGEVNPRKGKRGGLNKSGKMIE